MTAFTPLDEMGVEGGIFASYVKTGEKSGGAPVYECDSGAKYYLYKLNDGCWHAGYNTFGRDGSIRCCSDAPCPESTSDWQYNDHGDWRSGEMVAECLSGGGGGGGSVSSTQPTFHGHGGGG